MSFKMNLPKAAVLGVMLLLCLDVIHCFPITGTPGAGVQDFTGGPITAHCQSRDNDLGTRVMQNLEVWSWRFKPNVFGTTVWWCEFIWNTQTACFNLWDINVAPQYDASINDWRVNPNGFTLYDPVKNVWNLFHKWGVTCTGQPPAQDSTNTVSSQETESKVKDVGGTNGL